jgi:hypothetical protein
MTREEILNMPAGREMDALIAEKVLNLMVDYEFEEPFVPALRDKYDEWGYLPNYSADIAAAWEVVEKMRMAIIPKDGGGWFAAIEQDFDETLGYYERQVSYWITADTVPLVICRTALLAVMELQE